MLTDVVPFSASDRDDQISQRKKKKKKRRRKSTYGETSQDESVGLTHESVQNKEDAKSNPNYSVKHFHANSGEFLDISSKKKKKKKESERMCEIPNARDLQHFGTSVKFSSDKFDNSTKKKTQEKHRVTENSDIGDFQYSGVSVGLSPSDFDTSQKKKKKKKKGRSDDIPSVGDFHSSRSSFDPSFSELSTSPKRKEKMKLGQIAESGGSQCFGGSVEPHSDTFDASPKKKRKKKEVEESNSVNEDSCTDVNLFSSEFRISVKKKKKKKKKKENNKSVNEESCRGPTDTNLVSGEVSTFSKKKKKKVEANNSVNKESCTDTDLLLGEFSISPKKKKKKKKLEENNNVNKESCTDTNLFSSEFSISPKKKTTKKRKKEMKNNQGNEDSLTDTNNHFLSEFSISSKKKKKRKKETENNKGNGDLCIDTNLFLNEYSIPPKKKKRKEEEESNRMNENSCADTNLFSCEFSTSRKKREEKEESENNMNEDSCRPTDSNFLSNEPITSPEDRTKEKENKRVKEGSSDNTAPLPSELSTSLKRKKKKKKDRDRLSKVPNAGVFHCPGTSVEHHSGDFDAFLKKKKERRWGDAPECRRVQNCDTLLDFPSSKVAASPKKKKKEGQNLEFQLTEDDEGNQNVQNDEADGTAGSPKSSGQIMISFADRGHAGHERQTTENNSHTKTKNEASGIKCQRENNTFPKDRDKSGWTDGVETCGDDENTFYTSETVTKSASQSGADNHVQHTLKSGNSKPIVSQISGERSAKRENVLSCYICQEDMLNNKMYISHLAEAHNKNSYQCPKCRRPLLAPQLLEHHRETSCAFKDGEVLITPFRCKLCPFSYSSKQNLCRHKRVEHGIGKPLDFECRHCGQKFTSAARARPHVKKCEEGLTKTPAEPTIECQICGKLYSSRKSKNYHIKTIHHSKTFDCVCGKQFRGSKYYYAHRKKCDIAQ